MSSKWITTYTGQRFEFDSLDPKIINIDDIVHPLSMTCRFNGHCKDFYSVAEHSYILSTLVSEEASKYALLHDAAEAYLGDVVTPLKTEWHEQKEKVLLELILKKFGVVVTEDIKKEVHEADIKLFFAEARHLMPSDSCHVRDAKFVEGFKTAYDIVPFCWHWKKASQKFIERYNHLFITGG